MGLIKKLSNLIYVFIGVAVIWIAKKLNDGAKAKQEVLIDTYELNKKDLESGIDRESIDKVIDDTSLLYKPRKPDDSSSN